VEVFFLAITKSNIIITYRSGDADSESVADLYVSKHGLNAAQKISIPCSATEILNNESDFNSEVKNPISSAISTLEGLGYSIWAVVLGYNIPGGFLDGSNIISSTSRISRYDHSYSRKIRNPLFDRRVFSRYSENDTSTSIICSRIDAPNVELALGMINKADKIRIQRFPNGTFYLDPYSDRHGLGAEDYQNEILDFQDRTLPLLNLNSFITTFIDPYEDVIVPFVENDSFVWSWFTDRASLSFFRETSASRVFLYNADFDGAASIRDITSRRWPTLALRAGYACFAGSMSNPTMFGFLRPRPFFETLIRGGTIGEAMLFSMPFFDWSIACFGDPLLNITFPAEIKINDNKLSESESIRLAANNLARSISYMLKKEGYIEQIRDRVILSQDIPVAVDLLIKSLDMYNQSSLQYINSMYSDISSALAIYIESRNKFTNFSNTFQSTSNYLDEKDIQFSELIQDADKNINRYTSDNIYANGYWELEFELTNDAESFAFYHFEMDVSDSSDFSSILFNIKSQESLSGWTFEENENEFSELKPDGVRSSFIGRRIRYKSQIDQKLSRSGIYYFRFRQIDQLTTYDYREISDIIFT